MNNKHRNEKMYYSIYFQKLLVSTSEVNKIISSRDKIIENNCEHKGS